MKKTLNPFLIIIIITVPLLLLSGAGAVLHAAAPQVEIICKPEVLSLYQGEKTVLTVSVVNNTADSIRPASGVFMSYHLLDMEGKTVAYENPRFEIPNVLRRNKTTTFDLPIYFSHKTPGGYIVELDIVNEGVYWGSGKGWKTARVKLLLKNLVSPSFKSKYLSHSIATGNPLLDRHQYLLRMTLRNCELIKEGKLFGFAAGSTYPAVWIRDTATFMAYARHFYSFEQLAPGVELFLEHQAADGEIVDNVNFHGQTEKNNVETDQESSLVLAAHELGKLNQTWFSKTINGKTVCQRLEAALDWVWTNRRHKETQLITSGFTADWGDVENTYPDKRARRLSDKSTLVLGIYTQAKYIQAVSTLIKIFKQQHPTPNAPKQAAVAKWQERLNLLKRQTRKLLYLKDKGYYITHIVPSTAKYFKMEREMLPVGGNSEAIVAGLMSKEDIQRFLSLLEERRKTYNLRTVSFTLIPPYPENFFPHHLLRHPWNYQNGGEWDWIGGRLVKGLFLNGFRPEAEAYLLEIARKNMNNFCIFEWEDRKGTGRGALFYIGAAGVLGEAVAVGYAP